MSIQDFKPTSCLQNVNVIAILNILLEFTERTETCSVINTYIDMCKHDCKSEPQLAKRNPAKA